MKIVNLKKILAVITIVILIVFIKNTVDEILELKENSTIATSLQDQKQAEEKRFQFLKERYYYVLTDKFVENEAREKLGMVKEGEYVVLVPPQEVEVKEIKAEELPNWKKWIEVLL